LARKEEFGELADNWQDQLRSWSTGNSILHMACFNGRQDVLCYLISNCGCKKYINVENKDGETPFALLFQNAYYREKNLNIKIRGIPTMEFMMKNGSSLLRKSHGGKGTSIYF